MSALLSPLYAPAPRKSYVRDCVVVYRVGGTEVCHWILLENQKTRAEAEQAVQELERAGYKALVRTEREIKTLGIPIGWSPELVDPERDEIIVRPCQTVHIRHR